MRVLTFTLVCNDLKIIKSQSLCCTAHGHLKFFNSKIAAHIYELFSKRLFRTYQFGVSNEEEPPEEEKHPIISIQAI